MRVPTTQVISVGIIDDNARDREVLLAHLSEFQKDSPHQFQVTQFDDGAALLENYQPDFDVLFLDIQMAGIDGMRAAAAIRKVDTSVMIIFVTKTAQYATSGYSVQAQSYLLKPVSYFAFQTELNRSIGQLKRLERESILIGSRTAPLRVEIANIVYIESRRHKLTVHTTDDKIEFNGTLKEFEDALLTRNFYRSNSGYLVNLQHLVAINGEESTMSNGDSLKISRARKKGLLEGLTNYIGGKLG